MRLAAACVGALAGMAIASSANAETASFGLLNKYCIATDAQPAAALAASDADGFTAAPPDLAKTLESSPFKNAQLRVKAVSGGGGAILLIGQMSGPTADTPFAICAVIEPQQEAAGAAENLKAWVGIAPMPRYPDDKYDLFVYFDSPQGRRSVDRMDDDAILAVARKQGVHIVGTIGLENFAILIFGAVRPAQ